MTDTTKTGESVIHRRRADDWQTPTRKPWTAEDHDEATTKADQISMKAYGLAQVLKVCAFAAEARRTLTELEFALSYRDKVREDLNNHVHHLTNWAEMRDTSGDALEFIAQEMTAAMEESVNLVYGLAHRLTESAETAERGRAAA